MVVRLGVGIEPRAVAVHGELSDDAPGGEQVEGVVDRGLGDPGTIAAQAFEQLVGRQVLGRADQQRGDAQALRRRLDAAGTQAQGGGLE